MTDASFDGLSNDNATSDCTAVLEAVTAGQNQPAAGNADEYHLANAQSVCVFLLIKYNI